MNNFLSTLIKDIKAPGVGIVVVQDDQVLANKVYGFSDVENDVLVSTNSVFKLASVTKHITAFAILKLAEYAKLTLNQSVGDFFQEYPSIHPEMKIKHLLNHSSGIPNYTEMPDKFSPYETIETTHEQMLSVFINEPLLFEPGYGHQYSNSGYYLLGLIIEIISGKSYEEFITAEFFEPLGMQNTQYASDRRIIKNRVRGYNSDVGNTFETGLKNCEYINMNPPFSAGALCSSTNDMVLWCKALISGKLLKPESFEKAFDSTTLENGDIIEYGYGFFRYLKNGLKSVGHGGGISGFLSMLMYYPEHKTAILVFLNSTSSDPQVIEEKIANHLLLQK